MSVFDDHENIEINVKDPVIEDSGGFTSYMISGQDRLGVFEVRRRFNEFYTLRQGLKKRFPGCFIPAIPEKKVIGNKELKIIEDRKRFLDYFCKQIAKLGFIYYSDTFQILIRNKGSDLQKLIDSQPPPNTIATIQLYRQLNPNQTPKQNAIQARNTLNSFYDYLKKSQKQLRQLRDEIREVAQAKRVFNENLNRCNTVTIPDYEKTVFAQYVNHSSDYLLFTSNSQIVQKAQQLKDASFVNSFDHANDLISVELRQVICFQQAIESRLKIEQNMSKLIRKRRDDQDQVSKLLSGKTTFKSFFTRGNKQQQIKVLQKSIEQDQKQIDNLGTLIDLILIYQGDIELPRFKTSKKKQYYLTLNQVAKSEIKYLSIYGTLMKTILQTNQNMKYE